MGRLVALLLVFAPILCPQDAPTIRVETRLVEVEVVVRSSQGPVEDLTAADFTIFDRGRRQTITGFAIRHQSDSPVERPLSPTAFSNRLYRDQGRPIAPTVILLDTLNSRPQDMFELRRQLGLYLQRAAPNEPVAIYSLNKELTVVQDFTQDLERLRRLLARWAGSPSTDLNPDLQFLRDLYDEADGKNGDSGTHVMALIENVLREVSSMSFLRRADLTAYAFNEIAGHLAGIPGRKKLIWAGGGFPAQVYEQRNKMFGGGTDVRNYSRALTGALEALNEAQIAVYPIGVANPGYDPTPNSQLAVATRGTDPNSRANDTGQRGAGIDTMNLVAGATGGKAYYALTDTAGAVERAMEDAVVTYQLAFTPTERDLDGKYHELRVEVKRRGLEVRHRQGYLAAESKPPAAEGLRERLKNALEAPLDLTAIGLAAESIVTPAGQPLQYVLRVDMRDVSIGPDRSIHLTLSTHYPDSSFAGSSNNLDIRFTEGGIRDVLAKGYFGRVVIEHPDAKKVRFTVQDRATGRIGTLTITEAAR